MRDRFALAVCAVLVCAAWAFAGIMAVNGLSGLAVGAFACGTVLAGMTVGGIVNRR